jgi:hypothetical protein
MVPGETPIWATELLELRRGLVAEHLTQGIGAAAGADGDTGAAGDEGKTDIHPGFADGARAREPGQLGT